MSATAAPAADADTVIAPAGVTKAQLDLYQKLVPGKLRAVTVVRMTEDKFFVEAVAGRLMAAPDGAAWCRGMAVDPNLIVAAGSVVALSQIPVIEPQIFALVPDVAAGADGDAPRLVMHDADRARLRTAGVSTERIEEVADAFGRRSTVDNRAASIVVHVPRAPALPVAALAEGRTVLAAFAIPVDTYRDDVLLQGMPSIVASMIAQLGDRPAKAAYYAYFWQPWSPAAQNIKIFGLRYMSAADVAARKLHTHLITERRARRVLAAPTGAAQPAAPSS